ncbi:bifunctional hydroxymethylpyrimidine kinase/phosphomethylpyrimidine kinase [Comamonas antarctica]|uniref:Bifunctional hydroxymethylpyrimidine kinase/phosphomethylpyrimidine kinase n=1 Tax=Comamonas antarctica TaxID=2743470 RepID=A0A6N1X2M9_9BURK|nr:bifunctional hydroxymethylpyrimidine kinase/phosphomethylpyrimidine kinase [Comamonas antarctica]QKV51990.1 bifunctional hydroxymethylpyrimidine kinase/phosphomethylpyrimidine kinase [Comamonas antarctica]
MATTPTPTSEPETEDLEVAQPVCVLIFNANDPSGAGGLTADITTIASVGGHPLGVVTGTYVRDTSRIFEHHSFADDCIDEQARAVLQDFPVRAIKVGFAGSPENLAVIAEISSDYPELPIISYMPELSWWSDDKLDQYLDAFRELVLPQTSVLVGNHSTLWRWLLPDWDASRSPSARDLAIAAEEVGVPYVLVTGIPLPDQFLDNVLSTHHAVLASHRFEMFDGSFIGAGDTLSSALTALVASGNDLISATQESLEYLDHSLDNGFRPGMGHFLPDRMFWAQPEDDELDAEAADGAAAPAPAAPSGRSINEPMPLEGFVMPPHDTKH